MDKNLPKDIDDLFRDAIEAMRELPGENVWKNIEKQLDVEDLEKYAYKFKTLKKMAAVFAFLLLSSITIAVIYLNNYKSKSSAGQSINNKDNTSKPTEANNTVKDDAGKKDSLQNQTAPPAPEINAKQCHVIKDGKQVYFKAPVNAITVNKSNIGVFAFKKPADTAFFNAQNSAVINALARRPVDSLTNILQPFAKEIQLNDSAFLAGTNAVIDKHRKSSKEPLQKFYITLFAAPELATYNIDDDETSLYDNKQKINDREDNLLSASLGVLAGYHVNKHIQLQSGITYSISNIRINPATIYAVSGNNGSIKYQYNTSSGYGSFLPSFNVSPALGDSLFAGTAKHTLSYISVPFIASYRLDYGRFSVSSGIGVVLNFLTKATLKTEVNDAQHQEYESLTKLEGIRKFNSSLLVSAELQYHISNKWAVSAMPYFKYALISANKGYIVKTYPYNIGVGIGAAYGF